MRPPDHALLSHENRCCRSMGTQCPLLVRGLSEYGCLLTCTAGHAAPHPGSVICRHCMKDLQHSTRSDMCRHWPFAQMLTDRRLPNVYDHLYVVLRPQNNTSSKLSDEQLSTLRSLPAPSLAELAQQDAFAHSMTAGPAEAVAIVALNPPSPQTPEAPVKHVTGAQAPLQPRSFLRRRWQEVKPVIDRLRWVMTMFKYGWRVPVLVFLWMTCLVRASGNAAKSGVHGPRDHDLQVLTVAEHLQGQGIGKAVLHEVKGMADDLNIRGLKGLCQSEATDQFYRRCGFRSAVVMEHAHGWRCRGSVRKHWLVAWSNPSFDKEPRNTIPAASSQPAAQCVS